VTDTCPSSRRGVTVGPFGHTAAMTWSARLRELAHEVADRLVVGPVREHVDDRIAGLRESFTMASKSFDEAFERFASVQSQGFEHVRSFITAEVERAAQSGDTDSQRNLARLDAGIDSLAAGFAQFAAAANADSDAPSVPEASLPPVVNPNTPDPAETVSDPASGAPVDPVEVVNDPEVPTPADEDTASAPAGDAPAGDAAAEPQPGTAEAAQSGPAEPGFSDSANAQSGPATS
jgi:hypothetical protein